MSGLDTAERDALALVGVRKAFGSLEVLRGIDLAVAPHEVVCLIGASGSGKSTLLRCVNLTEPIDAGRILLGGEEITRRSVDANRVRRRIGIVFQSYNLFPHMTVLRNVTLAPRTVLGLSRADAETRATELLARFGLADKRDEYPDRLSGGMTMLIATHEMAFAREIASRVCFLDGGVVLEEAPPEELFTAPKHERTQQFLQRIVAARRL